MKRMKSVDKASCHMLSPDSTTHTTSLILFIFPKILNLISQGCTSGLSFVLFVYDFRKQKWFWYHQKNVLSCRITRWNIYQIKNCVLDTRSIVELMPTNIIKTIRDQNQTGDVHTALHSGGSQFPSIVGTVKLNMDKLIRVQETQEDHCGSGWNKITKRRQESYIYFHFHISAW